MDVYDFSTGVDCKDIYFVISDENIFGTLTVQEVEGNFYSSFDKTTYSKLQFEYATGDSICLDFYGNQFLVYTENGYYHADSGDVVTGLDYFNSVNANVTPIEIDSQIDLASIPMQKSVLYNNVLNVPLAANVLCGVKVYQGYALYYIGDSNRTEYLTSVYVSSEMMQGKTSFVYAVPNDWQGTEFSEWRWSACEG